jgi:hypothetical protein
MSQVQSPEQDVTAVEQEDKQPTAEEVRQHRENQKRHYEQAIPLLKKQREYEVLLADIEEAKYRKIHSRVQQLGLLSAMRGETEDTKQPQDPENSDAKQEPTTE